MSPSSSSARQATSSWSHLHNLLSPPTFKKKREKNESEGVTRLLLENLGSMTRFFLPFRESSIGSPGLFLSPRARALAGRKEEDTS